MKVYYSKMNVTPNHVILAEQEMIVRHFGKNNLIFHNSGKYDESKLKSADLVIVTGFGEGYVGKGVYSEIHMALDNGIPVFQFKDDDDLAWLYELEGCDTFNVRDMYAKYGLTVPIEDDQGEIKFYKPAELVSRMESSIYGSKADSAPETNLLY